MALVVGIQLVLERFLKKLINHRTRIRDAARVLASTGQYHGVDGDASRCITTQVASQIRVVGKHEIPQ